MATIYPETLQQLQRACLDFRAEAISLGELKSIIWQAASAIVSIEEARFRDYLQGVEGELDMIQFTTEDVRGEALKVVEELEIRARLHSSRDRISETNAGS